MLTTLNLENNCIDDIGAQAIADALTVRKQGGCCNLTHLDLTSNEITEVGVQVMPAPLGLPYLKFSTPCEAVQVCRC